MARVIDNSEQSPRHVRPYFTEVRWVSYVLKKCRADNGFMPAPRPLLQRAQKGGAGYTLTSTAYNEESLD